MHPESRNPRLTDTVTIGPFDSAHPDPRFLVQDGSGRCFQITDAGRRLLALLDGTRGYPEIARDLPGPGEPPVSAEDVSLFVDSELRPLGLISAGQDDPPPGASPRGRNPFFFRVPLLGEPLLRPVTRCLAWLFHPVAVVPSLLAVVALHVMFYRVAPADLGRLSGFEYLAAYALTCLSVVVHELGHASACRRFRCAHGPIGFGLYLIFPALYADVTPAWGLPRRSRAVIDAAGIYFQLLFCLGLFAVRWLGGSRAALASIAAIEALVFMTLNPLLKFDGYWLFSDLAGVPNLRDRAQEALGGMIRAVSRRPRRRAVPLEIDSLSVATRRVVQVYSAFMVAYFGFLVAQLGWMGPGLLRGLPITLRQEWERFLAGTAEGDVLSMANAALAAAFSTLIVTGWALCVFYVLRVCRRALAARR